MRTEFPGPTVPQARRRLLLVRDALRRMGPDPAGREDVRDAYEAEERELRRFLQTARVLSGGPPPRFGR